ncbi:hypothetical protein GS545_13155 [Rhodococcus hoagii]|nr:hypothetical protein [Prescottella equi]
MTDTADRCVSHQCLSAGYKSLHWVTLGLASVAAVVALACFLPAAIERVSRANEWSENHWVAFGTILGAAATSAAVVFSLVQNKRVREDAATAAANASAEIARREEDEAVVAILQTASKYTATLEATAEALIEYERHSELAKEQHAKEYGPGADASLEDIRNSLAESQEIIRLRRDAVQASNDAVTTTVIAIQKIRTQDVKLRASRLLGEINETSSSLSATGTADWQAILKRVPQVGSQVTFLMQSTGALTGGLVLSFAVEAVEVPTQSEDAKPE